MVLMQIFVVMHRTGEYESVFHEPCAAFSDKAEADSFVAAQTPRREFQLRNIDGRWLADESKSWTTEDWCVEDPIELDPTDRLPGS